VLVDAGVEKLHVVVSAVDRVRQGAVMATLYCSW
jgi:hypothetical protein